MSQYFVDLGIGDYKLLQDSQGYCFSQDSVLLANLASFRRGDRVLDLGCGTGVLMTLALVKGGADSAVGVDISPTAVEMARRSAEVNGLNIQVVEGDVRNISALVEQASFDKVLCNPPYFGACGTKSPNQAKSDARSGHGASLADFVNAAAFALKFGSDAYFCVKFASLASLFAAMCSARLTPKHVTLVYPKLSKGVDIAIVKGRLGGGEGLTSSTLIVKEEDGQYTQNFKELYT